MKLFALLLLVCQFHRSTTNNLCQCDISEKMNNVCCNLLGKCCEMDKSAGKTTKMPKVLSASAEKKSKLEVHPFSKSFDRSFQPDNDPTSGSGINPSRIFSDSATDATFTKQDSYQPIVILLSRPLPPSAVLLNTSSLFRIMKARGNNVASSKLVNLPSSAHNPNDNIEKWVWKHRPKVSTAKKLPKKSNPRVGNEKLHKMDVVYLTSTDTVLSLAHDNPKWRNAYQLYLNSLKDKRNN